MLHGKVSMPTVLFGLLCLIAGGAIYATYIAFSSPGREDTVDQGKRPSPRPSPPSTLVETLRQPWDAEAYADWPAAESLAVISQKAYLPPIEAEAAYAELGFDRTKTFVTSSMIGYVVSTEDVSVIVFRGTNEGEVSDWLVNLGRSSFTTPHGDIHEGFWEAYLTLKSQVEAILKQRPTKHVWIAGHSLGGALALACAFDLEVNEGQSIDGIMTFGQPMVARKELANYLDSSFAGRYVHYVNGSDIVPRVPPTYTHCGSLVWFTDDGVRRSKPKRQFGASEANDEPSAKSQDDIQPLTDKEFEALKARLKAEKAVEAKPTPDPKVMMGTSPFISDHSMELYIEKIRGMQRSLGKSPK